MIWLGFCRTNTRATTRLWNWRIAAFRVRRNDVHLLDTKGTILSKMPGRLAEARTCFEEILGQRPLDVRRKAATCLQLGRICVKLNDSVQARRHLEEALRIDGQGNVLTAEERLEIGKLMEGLTDSTASATDGQEQ